MFTSIRRNIRDECQCPRRRKLRLCDRPARLPDHQSVVDRVDDDEARIMHPDDRQFHVEVNGTVLKNSRKYSMISVQHVTILPQFIGILHCIEPLAQFDPHRVEVMLDHHLGTIQRKARVGRFPIDHDLVTIPIVG